MVTLLPQINKIIGSINLILDFVFLWGGLFVILQYPFGYFAKGMDKYDKEKQKNPTENMGRELLSQTFILILAVILAGFFWVAPELGDALGIKLPAWLQTLFNVLQYIFGQQQPTEGTLSLFLPTLYRWGLIFLAILLFAYVYGHENGQNRWLYSWMGHAALIFFGLVLDGWMGLIFISLPILLAYYSSLYRLAMVIVPTSSPEDGKERWKRFIAFAAYAWGIQFPMYMVDEHAWKKYEPRIPGDFTWDYPAPGLIWTKSHQVVGITGGQKFKRVAGPGLVFTGKLERIEQVFDLRLQIRSNSIDAVTRDGISLKVVVFAAFRIDRDNWDDEQYKQVRTKNPLLRGAQKPNSNIDGSFPYSSQRVQATLGVTSTRAGTPDTATITWDEWALNVVEDHARKIVAQKKLDELWRLPEEGDQKFGNALDVIANELKAAVEPLLRANGICLLVSRVVNFNFPTVEGQIDEFTQQQIATWGSEWEGRRSKILAEAQADSERAQQLARAHAASLMLEAVAEGLQLTKEIDDKLPQHVIALLFLSSLQDYIEQEPQENQPHYIKEFRESILPHHREKPR